MSAPSATGVVALLTLAVLCAATGGHAEETGAIQTPYHIELHVWRDEQPGDAARLHVSARFVPRKDAEAWSDVALAGLQLRAGPALWAPQHSALAAQAGGGFEIRAAGAATVAAGATVVPAIQLSTSAGRREIVLTEHVVERVE